MTVGVHTLGLVNIKILRACGVFHKKHGSGRAVLHIPRTKGVVPTPKWLGEDTVLSDNLCVIELNASCAEGLPALLIEQMGFFFQINYFPSSLCDRERRNASDGLQVQMSRIEQAICSNTARGYEEKRLVRLFKYARAKYEQCLFDVETKECNGPSACHLEMQSWLVAAKRRKPPGVRE